jgi:hypothetical protein
MAQTKTQRQATAKKAAATRKRNAAKRSGGTTRASARRTASSARRTGRSARSTGRSARTTARRAARTTGRRAAAETTRLEAAARQAERAVLIPIGVALEARDRAIAAARTYTSRKRTRRALDRYERRGAAAVRRNRRALDRQVTSARREFESRANGAQADAEAVVDRVRSLA